MTTTARDAILGRLRSARPTARLPRADEPVPPAAPRAESPALDRFRAEAAALGVECWVEVSADAVQARVHSLIAGLRVLSWDHDELPYAVGALVASAARGHSTRNEQAAADIGLTGCDAAIAETGSLVLLSSRGRARVASLLPPTHLAIVRAGQLYATMGEFFAERHADVMASSSCTFITGPSRTADIELTLTLGIHGPGRVIVVVGP